MAAFVVSLLAFATWRWQSLRAEVRSGHFSPEEFRKDPQKYVRGPFRILVIWFVLTIVLMFAIITSSIA